MIDGATTEAGDVWNYGFGEGAPVSGDDRRSRELRFHGDAAERQDPYNGVGSTVEVNFNWQDLFGNWLDADMSNQNWPDQGFPVGYIDDLIGLDEWPAVNSDYVIALGEQGTPELTVTLRFNADIYLPADDPEAGRKIALTDLGKFQLIYYQLSQPDVNVTLSSTMQPPLADPLSPVSVMVQFVLNIINFLTAIIEGQTAGRMLSARSLVFPEFDILTVENAWAGAAVKRNENLVPDKTTNPDFVLQSPVVRFINVLTPLLEPDVEINIAGYTTQPPASLNEYLSNFLIAFSKEPRRSATTNVRFA